MHSHKLLFCRYSCHRALSAPAYTGTECTYMQYLSEEEQETANLVLVPLRKKRKSHGNSEQPTADWDAEFSLPCHVVKITMSAALAELVKKFAKPRKGHGANKILQINLEEDAAIIFLHYIYTGSLGNPSKLSEKVASQLERFGRTYLPGISTIDSPSLHILNFQPK